MKIYNQNGKVINTQLVRKNFSLTPEEEDKDVNQNKLGRLTIQLDVQGKEKGDWSDLMDIQEKERSDWSDLILIINGQESPLMLNRHIIIE